MIWNAGMIRARGFTLIELVVVMAIIAILAIIAYPLYSRYAFRARRTDAKQLLMTVATAEERYYSTNNKYPSTATSLGYGSNTIASPNNYYQITVTSGSDNQSFTASALPIGAQATDVCGTISITNTGTKTPTSAASNSNGNCW